MGLLRGTLLGGGGFQHNGVLHQYLALIDLDAPEPRPQFMRLSFLGHGMAFDPTHPTRAVMFEKKGPGAAVLELHPERRSAVPLVSKPGRHFYGHGAFSADGRLLYATEAWVNQGSRGVLTVRDAVSMDDLGDLPTGGAAPHDCALVDEGRTMVVAHGGGAADGAVPCVTWIDVAAARVRDRMTLDSPSFNAGHLAVSEAGDLVLASAPRDGLPTQARGAVTLRPSGGVAHTLTEPAEVVTNMIGESLSVAIHERSGAVLTTHPAGDMAAVWDLKTGALRKVWWDKTGARGVAITLDQRTFVLSHLHGGTVGLSLIDTTTLQVTGTIVPSFTSGSHLFVRAL